MTKSNKRIEIVHSTCKGLSSMSRASCDAVLAVLATSFVDVRITVINNLLDLELLAARHPDLVFLGMKSIPKHPALGIADDEQVWLSEYLEENDIPCTGSGYVAHQFERNKPLAKQRVLDAGLSTPAYCVIKQGQPLGAEGASLHFPLFVKPTDRGGGSGIDSGSVIYGIEQLRTKVGSITTELQADSLVEEYLPGREFSVAILKNEYAAGFLVMPIELVAPPDEMGARLLSNKVKISNTEQALEVTDEATRSRVTTLALDVFHALGARDYGRIDIRLNTSGTPHFLEANLIPSLISGYGSFPKACVLNAGLEFEPMIQRITRLGLARAHNTENALEGISRDAPAPFMHYALDVS